MKLTIHTRGWQADHQIEEGETSGVMLGAVLEIDGVLIEEVTRVRVIAATNDFVKVIAHLIPGEVETIAHTKDSWADLFPEVR